MHDAVNNIEEIALATEDDFSKTGSRLNHILDVAGFKKGRGRVSDFQLFLSNSLPGEFAELKYTTVRSWFQNTAPLMSKIDLIVHAINETYPLNYDHSQLKTWWKVGGVYPFTDQFCLKKNASDETEFNEQLNKLNYVVIALVREETSEHFNDLSSEELIQITDKTLNFAKDFKNPFATDCPPEYLRMAIRDELSKILS